MTITNHMQRIEVLANDTLQHVDRKEYERAHIILDELVKKVHEAHRHIDHLQNVRDFCARPAGGG